MAYEDYASQVAAQKRRRDMARMLSEGAMSNDRINSVGGVAVPYSIGEGLSKLGQAWIAARAERKADKEEKELQRKRSEDIAKALAGMNDSENVGRAALDRIEATPDGQLMEPVTDDDMAQRKSAAYRNLALELMPPEQFGEMEARQRLYEQRAADKPTSSGIGAYQPGDYTPASWAKFLQTNDPAVLERYVTPRQEYSPSYQRIERTNPDGSTQSGVFDTRSGQEDWRGLVVPPGQKKRVDAQAAAEGEAAGSQASKAPAAASMEYVLGEFDRQLENTMQGGIGGIVGKSATVFDYQDAQRFDNLREQLSTELRTVYRIPGEGTLSDREQAQYGIQLPSRNNHPSVNRAILRDLRERTRLRLETPIVPQGSAAPAQAKRVRVDAEGNILGN